MTRLNAVFENTIDGSLAVQSGTATDRFNLDQPILQLDHMTGRAYPVPKLSDQDDWAPGRSIAVAAA